MSDHRTLTRDLIKQRDNIRDWLQTTLANSIDEQRHLDETSPERTYWHHGYQTALDDVIQQLIASLPANCSADRPN